MSMEDNEWKRYLWKGVCVRVVVVGGGKSGLKLLTFPAAFLSTKVFAMLPRAALGLASGF